MIRAARWLRPAGSSLVYLPEQDMLHFLNQVFDEVYVINLRSRADRMRRFFEAWPKLDFERFEAYGPEEVRKLYASMPEDCLGRAGCRESHIGVLTSCATRGVQRVLVMEDDMCPRHRHYDWVRLWADRPHDMRVVRFFGRFVRDWGEHRRVGPHWAYVEGGIAGTGCYGLLSLDTIRATLACFEVTNPRYHFDCQLRYTTMGRDDVTRQCRPLIMPFKQFDNKDSDT